MINVDPKERPSDQNWVHVPEFERHLYDLSARPASVKRLTDGPRYHWFGYYDKYESDPDDRYVLSMEVDFDKRSVAPGDEIGIGMIDRCDGNRWVSLATTTAWGWQQGCMLQWVPGSGSEIIFNTHENGELAARILNVRTGDAAVVPRPVYHLHPTKRVAVSLDFSRIQRLRPGYGYWVDDGDDVSDYAPTDNGIWTVDLDSGESCLIVTIADVAAVPYLEQSTDDVHYFNHAQWSPSGQRFLFLHRRRSASGRYEGFRTRLLTADADGNNIRVVCSEGQISHFVWRDVRAINVWIDGAFRLFTDEDKPKETVLWRATNGHQSYLSAPKLLVADTYADAERFQNLYTYDLTESRPRRIGRFYLPADFEGEWRCDLHPRLSRDRTRLFIDSAHEGLGRQIYEVELPAEVSS